MGKRHRKGKEYQQHRFMRKEEKGRRGKIRLKILKNQNWMLNREYDYVYKEKSGFIFIRYTINVYLRQEINKKGNVKRIF